MRTMITAITTTTALLLGTFSGAHAGAHEVRDGNHRSHHVAAQLTAVRRATAKYHDVATAQRHGYEAFAIPAEVGGHPTVGLGLPGDPTCFDGASGGMGVHYVKGIDGRVSATHPEAMVYAIDGDGDVDLVAVEYIVPEELVDPARPPRLFGQDFHHHAYLPVYILHAWVWKHNPNGMFADLNPDVPACPTGASM